MDMNTVGNSLWFYFKTKSPRANFEVKLNILNFARSTPFYNKGMKVLTKKYKEDDWHYDHVYDVDFYYNDALKRNRKKCYYGLSFKYRFEKQGDEIYFAYALPYTYT